MMVKQKKKPPPPKKNHRRTNNKKKRQAPVVATTTSSWKDEKKTCQSRMPAPMALRRAAKGGTVKTPRQLCFLSPRPRKVMVTEVKKKPVVVRRILRVDSSATTPRRLRFISSPVLPKKKKRQQQVNADDDEDSSSGRCQEIRGRGFGDERFQFFFPSSYQSYQFVSSSPPSSTSSSGSSRSSSQNVGEGEDAASQLVGVDIEAKHEDQEDQEDITRMDETATTRVEHEVDSLPAPRLIRDKVEYKVELHVPGVAIDVAAVHKPAPEEKVVTPSSSSLLTDWNRSAVVTALLKPPLSTLHLRIPLRPRPSFSSSTSTMEERDHAHAHAASSFFRCPIQPDAVARSLAVRGLSKTAGVYHLNAPYWTKKERIAY